MLHLTTGMMLLYTVIQLQIYKQNSVTSILNRPDEITDAFYCEIENTISSGRKRISLYPATADKEGIFYICTEFGGGYGSWYKFEGTVAPTAQPVLSLSQPSLMQGELTQQTDDTSDSDSQLLE